MSDTFYLYIYMNLLFFLKVKIQLFVYNANSPSVAIHLRQFGHLLRFYHIAALKRIVVL